MCRMFWVARSIKTRIRLIKSRFQHLKYFLVPLSDLIAVAILDTGTLDLRHLTDLFSSQAIHLFATDMRHIPVIDLSDQLVCINLAHWLQHISLNRFFGYTKNNIESQFFPEYEKEPQKPYQRRTFQNVPHQT